MRAVGKYIIIEKSKNPEVSASGLEYSEEETNKMRAHRATVISIGSEVSGINIGDDVYYDKARSFEQIIDGVEMTMTREVDIMVIIPRDEEV
jgi:co-chaperonin GroES (HSP10)|tara:strand:- start:767 stop:1042 length:276 start_codon:yes stop_codon:yes gene_type:complete